MRFKSLILVFIILSFQTVKAQKAPMTGIDLYEYIKTNSNSGNESLIASITDLQLNSLEVNYNRVVYAQMLVSHANRKLSNYQRALDLVKKINVDSISYEPIYYEVHMLKALLYQESGKWLEADSIYTRWIPNIPKNKEYAKILSGSYNNFASIKAYFLDKELHFAYLDSSVIYTDMTNDQGKAKRQNLSYKNLSNYFINSDIKQAEFWHNQIDTSLIDANSKISWLISEGKIQMSSKNYDASILSLIKARDLANLSEEYVLRDRAVRYATDAKTLQKKYVKEQNRNRITQFSIAGILLLIITFNYRSSQKKKKKLWEKWTN